MRTRALVVAVLVGSMVAPGISFADAGSVDVGTRVRLKSSAVRGRVVGRVLQAKDDSFIVKRDGGTADVRIPWASLSDLQVSRGTYGHPGTGAIVGGLVALPVAAFFSGIRNFDCQSRCYDTTGPTVAGTLVGVGLGAMVGLAVRTDRWQKAPLSPHVSLGIAPVRRGVGATLAVRF